MNKVESQLLAILAIARDTSWRGAGLSLRDALERSQYKALRNSFGPRDLVPLISEHPALIRDWLDQCSDKRTGGGWYVSESGEVGVPGTAIDRTQFDSLEFAVAEYVVRELDFWAGLPSAGAP